MNKKYILIFSLLVIFIILGIYFTLFYKKNSQEVKNSSDNKIESGIFSKDNQKIFTNVLTGEEITALEEPEFIKNRPLAVMVNNAVPARPQVGLTEADIIYEIIAEGGITRFLAIYYSNLPEKVGPIRSTREYYLMIVKELGDAMLMHIGFSPQAREKIDTWKIRSLGLGGGPFYRDNFGDPSIATEHTAFANGKDLFKKGLDLGWSGKRPIESWKFKSSRSKNENLKKADYIEVNFWYKGEYSGIFKYNSSANNYTRYSGFDENDSPSLLKDRVSNKTIEVSNVIVMFANEVPIPNDDKNRLDYELIGQGKAYIFKDGILEKATWKKEDLEKRTKFYLVNGDEVEFNRGKTWVSIVPSRNIDQVIIK